MRVLSERSFQRVLVLLFLDVSCHGNKPGSCSAELLTSSTHLGGGCLQQVTSGEADRGLPQHWGLVENPSLQSGGGPDAPDGSGNERAAGWVGIELFLGTDFFCSQPEREVCVSGMVWGFCAWQREQCHK